MSSFVKLGMKMLSIRPNCNYVTKFLSSGSKLELFRAGTDSYKKVLTKSNGNVITSHLYGDNYVLGINEVTKRGTISTTFGAQDYDKITQASVNLGGEFNYLGHKLGDRTGVLFSNLSGSYQASKNFMPEYKAALDYIRGKDNRYLQMFSRINNK